MAEKKALPCALISSHDKATQRSFPCALLASGVTAPTAGSTVRIDPGNGVEYEGVATEVVTANGESMVDFAQGLKPVTK